VGLDRDVVVERLQEYLRQPQSAVTEADAVARHQASIDNLWNEALRLADGDIGKALTATRDAVRSGQGDDESREDYEARLGGIPSRAFGLDAEYGGVDKPQHFFATAAVAFYASLSQDDTGLGAPNPAYGAAIAKGVGEAYEALDEIGKEASGGNPTGYSRGDVAADDRGANFGADLSLREWDPERFGELDVREFLPDRGKMPGFDAEDQIDYPDEVYEEERTERPDPDELEDVNEPVDYPEEYYDEYRTDRTTDTTDKFGG